MSLIKVPRGVFTERSRTFDEALKVWKIEGTYFVETVRFSITWDAQIDRGFDQCLREAEIRMETGGRDFLIEVPPEPMTRSGSGR